MSWKPGDGASNDDWKRNKFIEIDPQSPDRTPNQNYKLMISTTLPRPIALVSTISTDGIQNLAPFSHFNNVSKDPPIYSIAFDGEDGIDSLRNVMETGEMSISIVSDSFIEAANFTSVNTPPHVSEWLLCGLHPAKSSIIRPPYVAEAVFSMECKHYSSQTIYSKNKVKEDGTPVRATSLVLVEAVMFHVREDAIDENQERVEMKNLRPVWRGRGITYGSCLDGWEIPRPKPFRVLREQESVKILLKEPLIQE